MGVYKYFSGFSGISGAEKCIEIYVLLRLRRSVDLYKLNTSPASPAPKTAIAVFKNTFSAPEKCLYTLLGAGDAGEVFIYTV